ncbi:MAG TPA: hypothetical protein VJZ00_25480 [Thermoanaerobaculia bacterium]|nr:hypothetical protein [Thermoanaerobaculia bacterium]
MAQKTAEDVLEAAFGKIAETFSDDGAAYADLSGKVYDKKRYLERLRTDPEFAEEQLRTFIQPPPADTDGITPHEQRTLARRFASFAEKNDPDLEEFLRANPVLSEAYTVRDIKRVLNTLKFELAITPTVSRAIDEADDDMPLAQLIG